MNENQCRGCGGKSQYIGDLGMHPEWDDPQETPNMRWCQNCGTLSEFTNEKEKSLIPKFFQGESDDKIYEFELWQAPETGQFWWHLRSTVNKQIVAQGEGYNNKSDVIELIGNLRRGVRFAEIVDKGRG